MGRGSYIVNCLFRVFSKVNVQNKTMIFGYSDFFVGGVGGLGGLSDMPDIFGVNSRC